MGASFFLNNDIVSIPFRSYFDSISILLRSVAHSREEWRRAQLLNGLLALSRHAPLHEYEHQIFTIAVLDDCFAFSFCFARSVAKEMNTEVGQEVGYSIRFADRCDPFKTKIKFLTDGIKTLPTPARLS